MNYGTFKIGDWVVIRNYNDYQNGQEGEIIDIEYHYGALIFKVKKESGQAIPLKHQFIRKIEKQINYSELLEMALATKDKEWFLEITNKIKELKAC